MEMYKCKNLGTGDCSRADAGEAFPLAPGADDKCPECGLTLVRVGIGDPEPDDPTKRKRMVIASVVGAIVLVSAGLGYMKWNSNQVVILRPDSADGAVAPVPTPPPVVSAPVPTVPPVAGAGAEGPATGKPAPMLANEVAARKTCDEATKAKQPDAEKVCRRATAITLMNSGVLAAVGGKLEQAEKDYLAAREKDPDFPELYFNLAVLKARQNKGSEAVDNLTLASAKGFTQFSAIKNEPALQQIKSDPDIKLKIEAFEAR